MSFARGGTAWLLALGLLAGSAAGVAAQDPDAVVAPVEFTARWAFGPDMPSETSEAVGGVIQNRGGAWRRGVVIATSDQRLEGTVSIAVNSNDYTASLGPAVYSAAFRLENDDGAWQQVPTIFLDFLGGESTNTTGVLVGEGGYAGLVAIFEQTSDRGAGVWALRGYIIDGGLPPEPEPFVAR